MSEHSLRALVKAVAHSKVPKCKIQTHEWNFSKCPKNQLRFCQRYEYGRDTPSLVDQVKQWRASGFKEADQPLKENDQLARLTQMDFFRLFPEFPMAPWLALNAADVKTRLAGLKPRNPILVRSVGAESSVAQLCPPCITRRPAGFSATAGRFGSSAMAPVANIPTNSAVTQVTARNLLPRPPHWKRSECGRVSAGVDI